MIDRELLNKLSAKLADAMPADAVQLKQELEHNLRARLQSALRELNLVTREEFDAQAAVLARTREKLEALERTLAELRNTKAEDVTAATKD